MARDARTMMEYPSLTNQQLANSSVPTESTGIKKVRRDTVRAWRLLRIFACKRCKTLCLKRFGISVHPLCPPWLCTSILNSPSYKKKHPQSWLQQRKVHHPAIQQAQNHRTDTT